MLALGSRRLVEKLCLLLVNLYLHYLHNWAQLHLVIVLKIRSLARSKWKKTVAHSQPPAGIATIFVKLHLNLVVYLASLVRISACLASSRSVSKQYHLSSRHLVRLPSVQLMSHVQTNSVLNPRLRLWLAASSRPAIKWAGLSKCLTGRTMARTCKTCSKIPNEHLTNEKPNCRQV